MFDITITHRRRHRHPPLDSTSWTRTSVQRLWRIVNTKYTVTQNILFCVTHKIFYFVWQGFEISWRRAVWTWYNIHIHSRMAVAYFCHVLNRCFLHGSPHARTQPFIYFYLMFLMSVCQHTHSGLNRKCMVGEFAPKEWVKASGAEGFLKRSLWSQSGWWESIIKSKADLITPSWSAEKLSHHWPPVGGGGSPHSWTWLQHGRQGSRETSEQHDIYTKKKACFKEEEHDMWSSPEPRLTSWIGVWLALRVSRVSRKPGSTSSAACQVSRLGRAHSSMVRNWNMRFNMNTWCV